MRTAYHTHAEYDTYCRYCGQSIAKSAACVLDSTGHDYYCTNTCHRIANPLQPHKTPGPQPLHHNRPPHYRKRQPRNRRGWYLALLALTLILIHGNVNATPATEPPRPLTVTHLHIAVTVWSDGTIDTGPTRILTAKTARRLARRIEEAEDTTASTTADSARHSNTSPAISSLSPPSLPSGIDTSRCLAMAKSTGKQCRNAPVHKSSWCPSHSRISRSRD